jgi:phosphate transport system protein
MMREVFHCQLARLVDDLVGMSELVQRSMDQATGALLRAERHTAQQVVENRTVIAALYREVERRALMLVAQQQPVAADLRTVIAALRMGADLDRMGALTEHIARIAWQRAPHPVIPAPLSADFEQMALVAGRITTAAAQAITTRAWRVCASLERADDEMDRLHAELYRRLSDEQWPYGTGAAIDAVLISRYYERYADHAVSLARRVTYLTGHGPLDRAPKLVRDVALAV